MVGPVDVKQKGNESTGYYTDKGTLTLNFQGQIVSREWYFKVRSGICYISAKNGLIATKRKANISIKIYASNGTIGFDLGLEFEGQIWNLLYLS